ncbi:hypothetical protein Hanom_Chr00s000003g01602361 [Helianthus anomalus]
MIFEETSCPEFGPLTRLSPLSHLTTPHVAVLAFVVVVIAGDDDVVKTHEPFRFWSGTRHQPKISAAQS